MWPISTPPDDQTLRLQTGAGEDGVIHLPSGLDRVDCKRQEEEEEEVLVWMGTETGACVPQRPFRTMPAEACTPGRATKAGLVEVQRPAKA